MGIGGTFELMEIELMGYRARELFRQSFISLNEITVTHNLDLENIEVRLLIDNDPQSEFIRRILVNPNDPTNEFTIELTSIQTGVVQILGIDRIHIGSEGASEQYLGHLFGQFYTYEESLGASINATAIFANKVTLTTPAIDAGDYLVSWNFTWNMNQTSRSFVAQIDQDAGTIIWDMEQEPKDGNTDQEHPAAGFAQVTLTDGIHTFELDFANNGGGIARITNARVAFLRVF